MYMRAVSLASFQLHHVLSPDYGAVILRLQGKYDAVLRDYNKGLYLRDTRPNQLLPLGNTGGETNPVVDKANGSALSETQIEARRQQQKRVFDKIWSEVEKIMDEMRMRLESGLRNANGKNVEDIEKNIE